MVPKISAKLERGRSQPGAPNAGGVIENWRLSTPSVVNVARSQVYHTERPPYLFAVRSS